MVAGPILSGETTDLRLAVSSASGSDGREAECSDWSAVAASLAPLVREEALAVERLGTVTAPLVDAFRHAGLFRMMVPTRFGGAEAGICTMFDVVEELTAADASVGWSLMANMTAAGVASAFLDDEVVAEMLGSPDAVVAGMLGPRGTAVPAEGGFRWAGRYGFASGCAHATWIGAGAMVRVDGKVQSLPDGRPHLRITYLPREAVELHGNWDVFGLVGTGSYDYEVPEQLVEERYTFLGLEPPARRSGPTYQLGLECLGAAGHGAVAVGIARRALHELAQLAATKRRTGRGATGEQALLLHGFATADADWRGARALLHGAYAAAEGTAARGETISALQHAQMRQAVTHATVVGEEVVQFCYRWSGATGLRDDHPLGRCLRDMSAATQHLFVDPNTLVDAGRELLTAWGDETAPGL